MSIALEIESCTCTSISNVGLTLGYPRAYMRGVVAMPTISALPESAFLSNLLPIPDCCKGTGHIKYRHHTRNRFPYVVCISSVHRVLKIWKKIGNLSY